MPGVASTLGEADEVQGVQDFHRFGGHVLLLSGWLFGAMSGSVSGECFTLSTTIHPGCDKSKPKQENSWNFFAGTANTQVSGTLRPA
jgi:TRAP-type C4-dicarboxylate transport system permease large subunit